jgi:flagellar hook-associated protein 1 FlgK
VGADLLAILGQAANGLGVFRAATATAGNNIQNANTPGYSRQRVEPETAGASFLGPRAYLGRGVQLGGITQSRDVFLERQIPAAWSSQAQHTAQSDALASVSALDPDNAADLADAISAFYSSLRELSQNPSDVSLRTAVIGTAKTLASSFAIVGNAIESARTGLDTKFASDVDEANQLSSRIASLNLQISMARSRGAEPNDLLDQRLAARDRLSELTGATPVDDDDGNISMVLPSGTALVSGNKAATLSTVADATNDGHLAIRITRIGAAAPDALLSTSDLGGEIRGMLDARDVDLRNTLNAVDTLAFDFGNTFNAQHRAGFGLDQVSGRDFFTVNATAAGASRNLEVALTNPRFVGAAAAATSVPGDATNLNDLVATERTALSGGGDIASTLAGIIGDFGTATRSAKAMADQDRGIADHLKGLRESASGVSIDEEMIAMTQAQRAFEAVTKMITVTDSLLGTLMDLR